MLRTVRAVLFLLRSEFLKMNPRKQKFTNNDRANELLTRKYRHPFVVPEKV